MRLSVVLAALAGSCAGAGAGLPWEGGQPWLAYGALVGGACVAVVTAALLSLQVRTSDGRLAQRLFAAAVILGLAAMGAGGWLAVGRGGWPSPAARDLAAALAPALFAVGAGILVSCGGLVGVAVAHLGRPAE